MSDNRFRSFRTYFSQFTSTSIIYKALEDMGLRTQRFAGLVLGILVIEDLVAVVLMVLLSTMAVKNNILPLVCDNRNIIVNLIKNTNKKQSYVR